jgi:hypothetical protein
MGQIVGGKWMGYVLCIGREVQEWKIYWFSLMGDSIAAADEHWRMGVGWGRSG